jgi:hypothetical protein
MTNVSLTGLKDAVDIHAKNYENALIDLENAANSSSSGTLSISAATMATTKVQVHQSLTEMAAGIAKNATDHVKGLGRKVGGS